MEVKDILEKLVSGKMTIAGAEKELRFFSIKQIGKNIAKLDPGRKMRSGLPEVVLASGKKYCDLIKIPSKELLKLNKSSRKNNLVVESGQNSSCLLISKKRHKLTVTRGKVGI